MGRGGAERGGVGGAVCGVRFVVAQAKTYGVDTDRIVVSGESAGGHPALAAGMIPASSGFTNVCAGGGFASSDNAVPKVAAIINFYGITDLNDMLAGPNVRSYAVQWLGSSASRSDVARSVSP